MGVAVYSSLGFSVRASLESFAACAGICHRQACDKSSSLSLRGAEERLIAMFRDFIYVFILFLEAFLL
jgi:hypothetical protein